MDHGYFRDRISAFLDKELPPYEQQVVGEHLETCEECRELLHRLEKLESLVAQQSPLAGADYWEQSAQNIEQRIASQENGEKATTNPHWWGMGWKLIAAAASIAIITFIGLHREDISTKRPESISQESPRISVQKQRPDVVTMVDTGITREQDITHVEKEAVNKVTPVPSGEKKQPKALVRQKTDRWRKTASQQTAIKEEAKQKPATTTKDKNMASETEGISGHGETTYQSLEPAASPTTPEMKTAGTQQEDKVKAKKAPVITADELFQHLAESDSPSGYTRRNAGVEAGDTNQIPDTTPSTGRLVTVELTHWIARRDSLQILWDSLQEQENRLTLKKGSPKKSLSSIDTVEMQLLESYYNVALYSQKLDKQEFDKAKKSLIEYLNRSDIRHREAARNYLHRLETELK